MPEASGVRLDPAIAQQLGEAGRASAISGAARGGFVTVIADRGTVAGTIRDLASNVLREKGYRVIAGDHAPANVPRIRIRITEFWSYLPFNFGRVLTWTQQLKAWIGTDVVVKANGINREFSVSAYGANIIQVFSEENIRETYYKAMVDYSTKLDAKLNNSL